MSHPLAELAHKQYYFKSHINESLITSRTNANAIRADLSVANASLMVFVNEGLLVKLRFGINTLC